MQPGCTFTYLCCNPMYPRYAWDDAQRSGWFVGRVLRRGVPAKDLKKTLTLTLTLILTLTLTLALALA